MVWIIYDFAKIFNLEQYKMQQPKESIKIFCLGAGR